MNDKLIAIFKFMQDINPITTKITDENGNVSEVGRKPRKTADGKKLRGLFVTNPKPFAIAELELLVQAFNPMLVVRLTEPKFKDGKQIPSMIWVGQDFTDDTDEELSSFMEGL